MQAKLNKLATKLSYLIFLIAWIYRLRKLFISIQTGILFDFVNIYYPHAQALIRGNPDPLGLARTSFGPPFVYLPFIPFTLFPINTAELLLTLVNLLAFALTVFLLTKSFIANRNWIFWLLFFTNNFIYKSLPIRNFFLSPQRSLLKIFWLID